VAQKSGLKKGDRIVEVDGVNVEKVSHTNLIMKMKEFSKAVLLVVDEKTDEFFSNHNLSLSSEHLSGSLNLNRFHNCVQREDIKNTKSNRNVISQSNLMTSRNNRHSNVKRNLAVSTPNLSANYSSSFKMNPPDKVPAKNFTAKIISRVKSFASKREVPSKKYLEEARKFYDEIDDETMTSSSSSMDYGADFYLREFPDLARNSPLQSVDSVYTSPSISSSPRVITSYSEDGESSTDHLTTKASPQIANSNHKRIFSRSVYMGRHDNKNSPALNKKDTSFHNTLSSPVEPTKSPLNENSKPGEKFEEDFCEMDFQVSLETLKERVMKKSSKKERGRNSSGDYHIAHHVVNSY